MVLPNLKLHRSFVALQAQRPPYGNQGAVSGVKAESVKWVTKNSEIFCFYVPSLQVNTILPVGKFMNVL